MKKVLIMLCVMAGMALNAVAQDVPDEVDIETSDVRLDVITPAEPVQESKQEIKEREKRLREHNDDVAFAKASNSLKRGYFVLLADNIMFGGSGYRHDDINRNSNFILVQDEDGTFQFALNTGTSGQNGLGGTTANGKVRNKKINYGKNGDVCLQYQLVGPRVNATIHITLFHNSKRAVANITGGYNITIYGEILPYRDKNHR